MNDRLFELFAAIASPCAIDPKAYHRWDGHATFGIHGTNVIDTETLRKELDRAVRRFADESAALWIVAQRQHFLDLRQDPRPWSSPLRPANTNSSILLDRYVRLIEPEVVEKIGLEFAIAWMVMGVVTEDSSVFGPSP